MRSQIPISITEYEDDNEPEETLVDQEREKAKMERIKIEKSIKFEKDRLKKLRRTRNQKKKEISINPNDLNYKVNAEPLSESVLESVGKDMKMSKSSLNKIRKSGHPNLKNKKDNPFIQTQKRKDGAKIIKLESLSSEQSIPDQIKNFKHRVLYEEVTYRRSKGF